MVSSKRARSFEMTERLVLFISSEVNPAGVRARLVTKLNTDYKKLNRFCSLAVGERPIRDVTFMIEILHALDLDVGQVFSAAESCGSAEEMRRRFRQDQGARPSLPDAA